MAKRPEGDSTTEEIAPPEGVTPPEVLALAAGFPRPDREQWRELIAAVLRRAGRNELPEPVEDALRHSLGHGVDVAPLYVAQDAADLGRTVGVPGLPPFVRGRRAGGLTGWDVRTRHAHPDVAVTQMAIADDLNNGATSLWLVLGAGAIPVSALPDVLVDVLLDVAPVVLQAGPDTVQAAEEFFALAADRDVAADALLGNLGADPFGDALRTGADPELSDTVALTRRCLDDFPALRALVVDGTVVHDAGAGVVEELGYSLAAGVGYLRALTDGGLDIDSAFANLDFRYSASADQFLTIASLRAARRLWNRVGDVSGASPHACGQRQHAVTSAVMMTRRDPWVNMLRGTVACFAAGVGGADAVTVAPFDTELGLPDAFGRRVARNTQTLLMEEGHLARVLDPAGGSWYVESLTDQLAAAAWDWFTEIERAGGLAAAMSGGMITERIASVWADRRDRLAHRADAIIGVNEFPNLTERLPVREPYPARPSAPEPPTLPVVRAAEDFEALRDRVDVVATERESRPAVFLATLGSIAASTARASFAANLFQAAGLETPGNGADDGDRAIVSAFADSGTSVVCLCGTDNAYAQRAAALTQAFADAGATQVWIASRPPATSDLGRIDGHVFAGCDALSVLNTVLDELGVVEDGGGPA
ncbi:MAG: methylmalonyl-CoA mutase subunit beta [Actinomycetota bacterium]|nr:methylmalonyl-CoA mutase subunit beta [Actinomycetota bacterium]